MVDVCLVTSPVNYSSIHIPHYYLFLASWLEKEGISCAIVDEKERHTIIKKYNEDRLIHNIVKKIIESKAKYVGLAAFTTDYSTVMKLAHEIKKIKDITVIMGNVHATLMPQDFIFTNSPIDYVVIGEGELTASELIKNLESGKDLNGVKGLAYLKDSKYFQTEKRAVIDDLSILPRPCYEKINMDFYLTPTKYIIRYLYLSAVDIYTGRGCPYKCEFCAANTIWNQNTGKCVRHRPIDNVIDEIEYLKNTYDIDAFYILDDTFTFQKERVHEFCAKLKSKELDLIWGAETRVNLIDEKMVRAMKDAGCIQLDFGVESGSQKMLDTVKKVKRSRI